MTSRTRAAAIVAFLLALVLAGCAGRAPLCREGTPAEGEEGACFVSGEWVLRGGTRGENGPVVMLVHGANEDRSRFDGLSRALAANGTRVLSFDLRAHGESTRGGAAGNPATFTSADWAEILVDLRKAEGFTERKWGEAPSVVVGSSVGGTLGLRYAVENGTGSVVLLSPGLRYKGLELDPYAAAFTGRAFVVSAAQDAAGAETAAQMDERMPRAASVTGVTVRGLAHGTALLAEPGVVDRIVRFASAP